jgi:hypothetical protein
VLEGEVIIELDSDTEKQARCVAHRAGELGLLNALELRSISTRRCPSRSC